MFNPLTIPQEEDQIIRLCIIIPCYNEATKLKSSHFTEYLRNHPRVKLAFVNDGSKDGTLDILTRIQHELPDQISIVNLKNNVGKGEAVRAGVNYVLETDICEAIGYLDADLAVTLEECDTLSGALNDDISFCFGSRILRIGSVIERKASRFIIGRAVATLISQILQLKVYDTQCGCKLFRRDLAKQVFQEPFISRWLFDVEIFFRILQLHGREDGIRKMLEIPLNQWIDQGDSKVKPTYFFRMMVDLVKIRNKYSPGTQAS